jgi:hypothetical protein
MTQDVRYTCRRNAVNGIIYSIYDKGDKIAEICGNVEKRAEVALNIVRALNSRDRYLNMKKQPKNFDRYA